MAVVSAADSAGAGGVEKVIEWNGRQAAVRPGEWILALEPGSATKRGRDLAALMRRAGASTGLPLGLKRNLTVRGLSLIKTAENVSYKKLRAALSSLPGFRYVEPNFTLSVDRMPNDPRFGQLYALHNTGGGWGAVNDADIDAPEAWDRTTGNGSVVVGVIDTGVDYTHPDLAANIWRNPGETPGDGIDNDGNGFVDDVYGWDFHNDDNDPFDDEGHGTHVSGTIAAVGNNGVGISGVNWNARIMGLKFLGASGRGTTDDAIDAINYATMMRNRGVNIPLTNNSWGGGGDSQALFEAIRASGEAGMLFVAAAGNDGRNTDVAINYPSCYELPNIISVAASDSADQLASFSNYGAATVDLGAAGVDILSTIPGNGYDSYSGTSMAAPHVAGVAALAWSVKPSASFQLVRDAIYGGADRIASLRGVTSTGGRLNARNTLELIAATTPMIAFGAGDSTLAEPNNPGTFTFLRFGSVASALTVGFTVSGTASNGVDYALAAASVTVPAGETSALITVMPLDDLLIEGDETIQLTLSAGGGYELGAVSSMSLVLVDHVYPPANDNFETAAPIPTGTNSVTGRNLGATRQPGEPNHAGSLFGEHSVWWTWTADFTGNVTFHTQGSDFDTLLAVYTGSSVSALTEVASDNDSGEDFTSMVDFRAIAGTSYHIAVDSWFTPGNIVLSYARAPANDAFASRAVLSGASPTAVGSNFAATLEPGEPPHGGWTGGRSVWWTWTAPQSGLVTIDTAGSDFQTLLGVYTGSSVSSLAAVDVTQEPGGTTMRVSFQASGGTTYQIAVDGFWGDAGSVALAIGYNGGPITWDGGGDGVSWADPMNWSGDLIPGPTSDVTIYTTEAPAILITGGTHLLRSLISFEDLTISGGRLEVAQYAQLGGTVNLSGGELGGAGQITIGGTLNWTGGSMRGTGGTIISDWARLSMGGSGVLFSDRAIQIDGTATMQPGGNLLLRTRGLTLGSTASLDLADNTIIVDYSGASPIEQIRALLSNGYDGGTWSGVGIRSSTAAATPNRAIGYAEATDLFGVSQGTFAGQTIDATAVLLRYTISGDATLDRRVDARDLLKLAENWQMSGRRWSKGDFDFDRTVDAGDQGILTSNWQVTQA
ncbi:S8 family serine peptidase [Fontivita pretiosa]|uniref:S8 family serine peptidase n=1 Tax=Fontivita pretiosa TaxID=2989684 RepID=UPI003D1834DD